MKKSVAVVSHLVVALAFSGAGYVACLRVGSTRGVQVEKEHSAANMAQAAEKAQAYLDVSIPDAEQLSNRYKISRIEIGNENEVEGGEVYWVATLEEVSPISEESVLASDSHKRFLTVLRIPAEGEPVLSTKEIQQRPRVRRVGDSAEHPIGGEQRQLRVRRVPVPPRD
jgi:hypothetical protein